MRTSLLVGQALCLLAAFAGALSARLAGATAERAAAQHAPAAPAAGTKASAAPDFSQDVLPIIENNCLRCHSAAAQKGGLILDTHEDLMQGGENGTVLTPGDATKSRLVQMIQAEIDPKMPPKSTLRPDEIATFKAWIDAGAKGSAETPLARLEARITPIASDVKGRPAVHALAFNPDGTELAVPGYREVRRVAVGAAARAAAAHDGPRSATAHRARATDATQATDATAGRAPPAEASAIARSATARAPFGGAIDLVRSVAYSRDGAWIAGAGGIPGAVGEVLVWNAATGALAHTLKGHRDYVYQVVFNRRGTRVATCSYDKTIRVWDVETGRPTHVFREHTEAVYALAFSPDDRWLASGAGDRSVKIWDLASGARLYTLTEPTDVIQSLAFHPVSAVAVAAAAESAASAAVAPPASSPVAATAAPASTAPMAPTGRTVPTAPTASATSAGSAAAAAAESPTSPAGARNAPSAQGAQGGQDEEDEEDKASKRPSPVFTLSAAGADKTIRTWTLTRQGGTLLQSIRGHSAPILRIAYSPDGKSLASSADDGSVKIWEVATGKERRTLEQQPDWAQALAWSPDGARLAVGRFDGTVGLYDAATGRRLSQFAMGDRPNPQTRGAGK